MEQPRDVSVYVDALREELMYLWTDLAEAYRMSRATPPESSPGFENVARRIHAITALVGPISTDQIEMPFLLTGMYEKVHADMGLQVSVPEDCLADARAYMESQQIGIGRG